MPSRNRPSSAKEESTRVHDPSAASPSPPKAQISGSGSPYPTGSAFQTRLHEDCNFDFRVLRPGSYRFICQIKQKLPPHQCPMLSSLSMGKIAETELYAPVKSFLEKLGLETKAEIGPADVVGLAQGKDPVIVELKVGFSLALLQQAVSRQSISDSVYVAVPRWKGKAAWKSFKANVGLCKRLGIGVMSVDLTTNEVKVHAEPVPYTPRKSARRKATLLSEFERREGDPNQGGTRGPIVTAYRQEALRCAHYLAKHGATKGSIVARAVKVPHATRMMRSNHFGWFSWVSRGIYDLSREGQKAARNQKSA